MLIVYKFNFKLLTIWFFLVLRRGEKLHNVILGEKGAAQDSHDLHDGTSKLEVVLNDSDETVCDDGRVYLYVDSVLAGFVEFLDMQMLLQPFEKLMRSFS